GRLQGNTAVRQTQRGQHQGHHGEKNCAEAPNSHGCHLPSAFLSNKLLSTVPIRSSRTKADWVSKISPPSASNSSLPPTAMLIYFSPSTPAVLIEAMLSSVM